MAYNVDILSFNLLQVQNNSRRQIPEKQSYLLVKIVHPEITLV